MSAAGDGSSSSSYSLAIVAYAQAYVDVTLPSCLRRSTYTVLDRTFGIDQVGAY